MRSSIRDASVPFADTKRHTRSRGRTDFIECLESRLLLTTFTWTDASQDHKWSAASNWDDGTGIPPSAPPAATDDVVIQTTTDITVDITPTIQSLKVGGSRVVTFNFADNQNLVVNNDFTILQAAGHTGVVLNANAANSGKLSATNLTVSGAIGGSTSFFVNAKTTLFLTGKLDAGTMKFDLTDGGTVRAANADFLGRDLPAPGNPVVASVLNVTGTLTVTDRLRVGGNGKVDLTMTGGTANLGELFVPNVSSFTAKSGAVVTLTGDTYIGGPGTAFAVPAAISQGIGGLMTIDTGAAVTSTGDDFQVSGGDQAKVVITNAGSLHVESFVTLEGAHDLRGSQFTSLAKVAYCGPTTLWKSAARGIPWESLRCMIKD
jgi:hypothetical protein